MNQRLKRHEVSKEMTWDLDALYESKEAWLEDLQVIQEEVKKVTDFKGRIKEGGHTLYAAVKVCEDFVIHLIKLGTYV